MPKRDRIEVLFSEIKKLKKEMKRKPPPRRSRILESSTSSSPSSSRDSSPSLHNQPGDIRIVEDLLRDTIDDQSTPAVGKTVEEPQPGSSTQELNVEPEALTTPTADDLPELTDEILEILGVDPTANNSFGKEIQKDLAARLEHLACNGLSKELRKELREKYLIPSNCILIDAPSTNLEIKAAVSELVTKKLGSVEAKQKQIGNIIACLGEAITHMLSQKEKDPTLLKMVMDATRMACDLQYSNSLTRRTMILASLKKDMKDQLITTKIDKFLFGKDLVDTIKSAKAISKQGAELKASVNPITTRTNNGKSQKSSNQHLNWKRASATVTRSSQKTPKTREPARQKSQRETSSRRSRQNTTRWRQ